MKLAFTFIPFLVAVQFCSDSQAADWVPLGGADAADQYFYDRSRLTIKDEEISYWKRVVFSSPQSIHGKEAASGLLRERIHCAEHTIKVVSYLYYSATGRTVEYVAQGAQGAAEAAAILPDSVADALQRKLCPLVWQKQEENRIKAAQEAAEAELSAMKNAVRQPENPPAPPTRTETAPQSPDTAPAAPLPTPPIIDQLY